MRTSGTKAVYGLTLALGAAAPFLGWADDAPSPGHFRFSGPMSRFLPEGSVPAPVTRGVPFVISLSDNGARIAPDHFDLAINGAAGPVALGLDNLKFSNGQLTAQAKLHNGTGAAVEGVRLDITGATDEYKDKNDKGEYLKDEKGNQLLRTRPQSVSIPSPLFFGDLAANDDSDALPLAAGTLAFTPDTTRLNVSGVLSGLRLAKDFSVGEMTDYEIDTDAGGRVYVAGGDRVVCADGDGAHVRTAIKGDPDCQGVAIDQKTGDILVNSGNTAIIRYSPGGNEISRITVEKNGIEFATDGVRLDNKGRIYNCGDNQRVIQCIEGGRKIWTVPNESEALFDVDAAQHVYACRNDEVAVFDANGQPVKKFAFGPDWHFGRVTNPRSVRLDSAGQVYILEGGKEVDENGQGAEAPRVSVFDQAGRMVRVWGRGGKAPVPDEYLPGQVYRMVDLAFGPNGNVYVLCPRAGGETHVLVFQPMVAAPRDHAPPVNPA